MNYQIWKSEPKRRKKGIISDWADDSQSCISTNIDERGWFFVPKKSKLLQCHEIEFQFALIQALSRIILSLVTFQLNYMNMKMPLTPFLRKCPINKSTVKYLLMKYIWNQQFITKEFMLDSSRNETSKLARTVLVTMIVPMIGAPAFVCRLIPVYSLKHELSFHETLKVINLFHRNKWFVFLLMSDSFQGKSNQAWFKIYQKSYRSDEIFACNHNILNVVFKFLYFLYNPTYLLKNIRNNWPMEKHKKIEV